MKKRKSKFKIYEYNIHEMRIQLTHDKFWGGVFEFDLTDESDPDYSSSSSSSEASGPDEPETDDEVIPETDLEVIPETDLDTTDDDDVYISATDYDTDTDDDEAGPSTSFFFNKPKRLKGGALTFSNKLKK
jgi:hypothetical protein